MLHPYGSVAGALDKQKFENNPKHSTGIIVGAANPNNRLHILERGCGGGGTRKSTFPSGAVGRPIRRGELFFGLFPPDPPPPHVAGGKNPPPAGGGGGPGGAGPGPATPPAWGGLTPGPPPLGHPPHPTPAAPWGEGPHRPAGAGGARGGGGAGGGGGGALGARGRRGARPPAGGAGGGVLFFVPAPALSPSAAAGAGGAGARLAPGALLAAALLAALLPLDRLLGADAEDGSLDQLLLSGLGPAAIAAAKALAHWITTGLPLLAATPVAAAMLNLPVEAWGTAMAALGLAAAFLSLLGTAGAALTLGARRGGVLLPLIVLPLAIPSVIFGAAAIEAAAAGGAARPYLLLLAALVAAATPLAPLAAGAALRGE